MAFLDDQNGRPAQQKFLDLSSLKPQTKEEVQNAVCRLPEMKLRPEKIPEEENVVKPMSSRHVRDFPYLNPVPPSMLHVNIRELSKVDIDWKMLTLERPETALEVQIFTRIIYLNKVTLKCVVKEKARRERAQSIRLRMLGKIKPAQESDNEKVEEFTYEHFSRHYGIGDRGQAMEEVPKPPPPEGPKIPPPSSNDQPADLPRNGNAPSRFGRKKRETKGQKKKRKIKKRKKSRKQKTRLAGTGRPTPLTKRKSPSKPKPKSKSVKLGRGKKKFPAKKRNLFPGKTLVQMLKVSEKSKTESDKSDVKTDIEKPKSKWQLFKRKLE